MIRRLYDAYVDRLAADRGVTAFVKWFAAGFLMQLAFVAPGLGLIAWGAAVARGVGSLIATLTFAALVLAARIFIFALPCKIAAERKGLGPWEYWGVGGFIFGPLALALVAALSPKNIETAAS